MPAFIALCWNPAEDPSSVTAQALRRRAVAAFPMARALVDVAGLAVLAIGEDTSTNEAISLPGHCGAVVGRVFSRNSGSKATITTDDARSIVASGGSRLMSDYWGRYIAFLHDPQSGRRLIVKDPTGRFPCHFIEYGGVTVLFSRVGDFVALGVMPLTLDWTYVRTRVALGGNDGAPFSEVKDMLGGECIEFRGSAMTRAQIWNPRSFAGVSDLEDPVEAARLLRDAVKSCTHSWAGCSRDILLRLSGGLDSSIVAGCLRDALPVPEVTCLTYHYENSTADERPWARQALAGAPWWHVEVSLNQRLDLAPMLGSAVVLRPNYEASYLLLGPTDRAHALAAGADVVLTGEGGDSNFGSYAFFSALDEYRRRHGVGTRLLRIAMDVALRRNTTLWRALKGLPADDRISESRQTIAEDVFRAALTESSRYQHPWLGQQLSRNALEIVRYLTQDDFTQDPFATPGEPQPDFVHPLLSQPVTELCLSLPSYLHFFDGRDRGLARSAFTADVPAAILQRQWKDVGPGFAEDVVLHNRALLKEVLLEGRLMREGVLNRGAVEASLSSTPAKAAACAMELLDLFTVEAWLSNWRSAATPQALSAA